MIGTIAITDEGWYRFLAKRPELTEVNFWTPSARRTFRAEPFSPFLFKLRAPHSAICGFAYFAQFSRLPDWFAWECFGQGNGCATLGEMRARIASIRERIRYDETTGSDEIGCIQLVSPTFFAPEAWVPQPTDWHPRIQTPMKYDLAIGEGRRVWETCVATTKVVASETAISSSVSSLIVDPAARYGEARLVLPRLGQGTFRVAVTEAYGRACAVTEEHSLPALEAVHISPFAEEGPHAIRNGMLLRADFHRLFDAGYITVTPDLHLEVGRRLKKDYENGRSYYPYHGRKLRSPAMPTDRPDIGFLRWHNEHRFLG